MADKKKARDFSFLLQQPPQITKPAKAAEPQEEHDEEAQSIAAVMGFSSFGNDAAAGAAQAQASSELLAAHQRGQKRTGIEQALARLPKEVAAAATLSGPSTDTGSAAAAGRETDGAGSPAKDGAADDDDDYDDDDDADDDDLEASEAHELPTSHEIDIRHGDHPILALNLETSGARMLTGSSDYSLKMWDFHGMDARLQAFRALQPFEGYPVRDVVFSPKADMILVCTGSSAVKVLDREGKELLETKKGDGYLFDLAKTAGHVSIVNCGCWHPTNFDLYLTGSNDGTIRIWNIYEPNKSVAVGKCRSRTGKRLHVLSCTYNSEGKMIAAGCSEGVIQYFSCTEKVVMAKQQVANAHAPESEVSCVLYSRDNKRLYSRATDGTLKLWEVASSAKPKHVADNLPSFFNRTECCLSPDEQLIVTGTSGQEDSYQGLLVFLKADTLERISQIGIGHRGAIRVSWHARLNQIMLGCSDGVVKVLFDPRRSIKGATLCATRKPRAADPLDALFKDRVGTVLNPHGLKSLAGDVTSTRYTARRRKEKARADPKLSHKPEPPVAGERGVGKGGRPMGYTSSLSQYIAKRTAYDATRDQDPREEILKFANAAESEPYFVARAYTETQPQPVYDMSEPQEDEEEGKFKKHKFDPNKKPKLY